MIEKHDLKTLAEMGKALWANPRESEVAMIETLSAVTLLDLTPERAVEKAAAALLERVTGTGGAVNFRANLASQLGMTQPFFRLAAEERFLLIALHLGRWSYGRIARIFKITPEQVEIAAWSARLRFASLQIGMAGAQGFAYPTGAPQRGPNCPQYDSQRPWTQRFLDEENSTGRERVFFQNHLMACSSCREALHRCREAYYAIEGALPGIAETSGEGEDARILRTLQAVTRQSLGIRLPVDRTFAETLEVFARRRDVQFTLAFLALVTLLALRKVFN